MKTDSNCFRSYINISQGGMAGANMASTIVNRPYIIKHYDVRQLGTFVSVFW